MTISPPASQSSLKSYDPLILSSKEQAEWNYKTTKLFLGRWQKDFDYREDKFDKEHFALVQARATGSRETAISELDRQHILDTQQLAQALTNAEAEFYAAKKAAVAVGVDFGSEAESGFASRPDDGYSLSFEVDGESFTDCDRITKWLESLSEYCSDDEATPAAVNECMAGNDRADHEVIESEEDQFELESVDLCETRSAIAEGPWRRRIDKWNSMRRTGTSAEVAYIEIARRMRSKE